jgi:hypothetical protein
MGHVILGADRLFGVSSWTSTSSVDVSATHVEAEASGTLVNVLWGNGAVSGGGINVFAVPKFSIDAFVGPQVTLGGSVGFMVTGGSSKTTTRPLSGGGAEMTSERDYPDSTAFMVTPRIGVIVPVGPRGALWLRGGFTYYHSTTESTSPTSSSTSATTVKTTTDVDGTALTFDPVLVLFPIDHVGITLGPVLDIGIDGSSESSQSSSGSFATPPPSIKGDLKQSNYGGAAGMLVFF